MPRKKGKNAGPFPIPAAGVTQNAARFVTSQRNVFRNTEPILRQDPVTATYLTEGGGLSGIMQRTRDPQLQRTTFNTISSAQNALFLSRVSNDNLFTLPNLQEIFEGIRVNTRIATAIATDLAECCQTIQSKLDELKDIVNRVRISLRVLINQRFDNLLTVLRRNFLRLTQLINTFKNDLFTKIDEQTATLSNALTQTENNLVQQLNSVESQILQTIGNAHSITRSEILGAITEAQAAIMAELGALAFALGKGFSFLELVVLAPAFATIAASFTTVETTLGFIKAQETRIENDVLKLPKFIQTKVDYLLKEIKEYLKDLKEELIKEIVDQVSLTIVGEAYTCWDSLSTYFPALTFIFNEENASNQPRKTQIKIRLKMRNPELTDDYIEELRENTRKHSQLRYTYGCVRGNYVHNDKKFKTTIWGKNDQEITNILKTVMQITDQQLEPQCLSFTRGGTKRLSISKRVIPLDGVDLNPADYREEFGLKLRSAILLVNGLKRPIRIL